MRRFPLLLTLVFSLLATTAHASETPAEHLANQYAAQELAAAPTNGNLPDYTLSPTDLAKAQHLAAIHCRTHFADELWAILQLILLLHLGLIARMRDRALHLGQSKGPQRLITPYPFVIFTALLSLLPLLILISLHLGRLEAVFGLLSVLAAAVLTGFQTKRILAARYRWVEAHIFAGLLLLTLLVLDLPLSIYRHHLSLAYGLSVQRWPGWALDQTKAFLLSWFAAGLLVLLLFWVIRSLPRSWWLAFWACTIPITVFGVLLAPYAEPLFFHYEPLTRSHSDLAHRLETVVQKGHLNIPTDRMFLMQASAKLTTLNADVEGFGPSKRVVVWDNTIQKLTPDQILFVFGHESGHYVLGHILRGLALSFIGSFVLFFSAFYLLRLTLRRFGPRWRIPSQNDWATAAVLLLLFTFFSTLTEPIEAAISRSQEHAADIYGQEAIHNLVPNPQATAQTAFDVLGQTSFDDPNPPLWFERWTYDHPAIGRRAAFAHAYNPWLPIFEPKYFPKP